MIIQIQILTFVVLWDPSWSLHPCRNHRSPLTFIFFLFGIPLNKLQSLYSHITKESDMILINSSLVHTWRVLEEELLLTILRTFFKIVIPWISCVEYMHRYQQLRLGVFSFLICDTFWHSDHTSDIQITEYEKDPYSSFVLDWDLIFHLCLFFHETLFS